jgi:hypothetical protein
MNDFIQPIGPADRDIEAVYRVERARDEGEGRQPEQRKRRPPQPKPDADEAPEGPIEGDDGHLHIDIRA